MKYHIKGKQLFLRYGMVCLPVAVKKGRISQEQAGKATALAINGGRIEDRLIKACFPNAFREYQETNNGRLWMKGTVEQYWRNIHGKAGMGHEDDIFTGVVGIPSIPQFIREQSFFLVLKPDNIPMLTVNPFSLSINTGDVVVVHQYYIVEIMFHSHCHRRGRKEVY